MMSHIHGRSSDGTMQEIGADTSGNLKTTQGTLLAGELQQFNRLGAGPIVQYKVVTSDATGLNVASGPAILYGVVMIAAGTMAAVYDGVTAAGNVMIPSTTVTFMFNGAGILCDTGITCDWTSGTWLVLYVPAA